MKSTKKLNVKNASDMPDSETIIKRLNKTRKEVSRGRVFSDSAALIREMRDERDKELDRAISGDAPYQ